MIQAKKSYQIPTGLQSSMGQADNTKLDNLKMLLALGKSGLADESYVTKSFMNIMNPPAQDNTDALNMAKMYGDAGDTTSQKAILDSLAKSNGLQSVLGLGSDSGSGTESSSGSNANADLMSQVKILMENKAQLDQIKTTLGEDNPVYQQLLSKYDEDQKSLMDQQGITPKEDPVAKKFREADLGYAYAAEKVKGLENLPFLSAIPSWLKEGSDFAGGRYGSALKNAALGALRMTTPYQSGANAYKGLKSLFNR